MYKILETIPCRGCTERTAECHTKCERYREWEKKNAERRDTIKKQKAVDREMTHYKVDSYIHRRRYRNNIPKAWKDAINGKV